MSSDTLEGLVERLTCPHSGTCVLRKERTPVRLQTSALAEAFLQSLYFIPGVFQAVMQGELSVLQLLFARMCGSHRASMCVCRFVEALHLEEPQNYHRSPELSPFFGSQVVEVTRDEDGEATQRIQAEGLFTLVAENSLIEALNEAFCPALFPEHNQTAAVSKYFRTLAGVLTIELVCGMENGFQFPLELDTAPYLEENWLRLTQLKDRKASLLSRLEACRKERATFHADKLQAFPTVSEFLRNAVVHGSDLVKNEEREIAEFTSGFVSQVHQHIINHCKHLDEKIARIQKKIAAVNDAPQLQPKNYLLHAIIRESSTQVFIRDCTSWWVLSKYMIRQVSESEVLNSRRPPQYLVYCRQDLLGDVSPSFSRGFDTDFYSQCVPEVLKRAVSEENAQNPSVLIGG